MLTDALVGAVDCNEGLQVLRLSIYFPVVGILAWSWLAEGRNCGTV